MKKLLKYYIAVLLALVIVLRPIWHKEVHREIV